MVYLGADHGGFQLKEQIKQWLNQWNIPYQDIGAQQFDAQDDYPQFALAVAQAVARHPQEHRGILACRSAAGMVIAANKVKNVRAVAPHDVTAAQHAREHNDANVLGLSGDWLNEAMAKDIVHIWLNTAFSQADRHLRRLDTIKQFEQQHWH
ncbi:MAG: RpiB/LacA/LacB family sugar-phosphate isomerase [Candidatus Kerfeldbacteria bacterium]|nr:RpiB/LacA/LacB family sugar-phosphate isomerase [Candidatus Kerfeldbacteria bacterium]